MTLEITPSDFYSLYSPSKCELRLYLSQKGVESTQPSEFMKVIFKLGQRHEKNHLATFQDCSDLTGKPAEMTLDAIQTGCPVIYQGSFKAEVSVDGQMIKVIGIPDFLSQRGG